MTLSESSLKYWLLFSYFCVGHKNDFPLEFRNFFNFFWILKLKCDLFFQSIFKGPHLKRKAQSNSNNTVSNVIMTLQKKCLGSALRRSSKLLDD